VTAGNVDSNGLGEYNLTVDRAGKVDAIYTGQVDFGLSDGNIISVNVTMRVQNNPTSSSGNAGYLYLVLFDPDLNNKGQVDFAPVDGVYDFQLTDISAGDYYLVAGSDVDNDNYICEVGESCAAYPAYGNAEVLKVDRNLTGLDFLATINSGLSSSSASSSGMVVPAEGFRINPQPGDTKKVTAR
jgi:serine protease